MDNPVFISEEQRDKLRTALNLVKSVRLELTYEHEEYFPLFTAIDALRGAIEREEKYF